MASSSSSFDDIYDLGRRVPVVRILGIELSKCYGQEKVPEELARLLRLVFPSARHLSVQLFVSPTTLVSVRNLLDPGHCTVELLSHDKSLAGEVACQQRLTAAQLFERKTIMTDLQDLFVSFRDGLSDETELPTALCCPIFWSMEWEALAVRACGSSDRLPAEHLLELVQATSLCNCLGSMTLGLTNSGAAYMERYRSNLALLSCATAPHLVYDGQRLLEDMGMAAGVMAFGREYQYVPGWGWKEPVDLDSLLEQEEIAEGEVEPEPEPSEPTRTASRVSCGVEDIKVGSPKRFNDEDDGANGEGVAMVGANGQHCNPDVRETEHSNSSNSYGVGVDDETLAHVQHDGAAELPSRGVQVTTETRGRISDGPDSAALEAAHTTPAGTQAPGGEDQADSSDMDLLMLEKQMHKITSSVDLIDEPCSTGQLLHSPSTTGAESTKASDGVAAGSLHRLGQAEGNEFGSSSSSSGCKQPSPGRESSVSPIGKTTAVGDHPRPVVDVTLTRSRFWAMQFVNPDVERNFWEYCGLLQYQWDKVFLLLNLMMAVFQLCPPHVPPPLCWIDAFIAVFWVACMYVRHVWIEHRDLLLLLAAYLKLFVWAFVTDLQDISQERSYGMLLFAGVANLPMLGFGQVRLRYLLTICCATFLLHNVKLHPVCHRQPVLQVSKVLACHGRLLSGYCLSTSMAIALRVGVEVRRRKQYLQQLSVEGIEAIPANN